MIKKILIIFYIISLFFVIGCSKTKEIQIKDNSQIANPASVYCEEQGGRLEIRTNSDGSQAGYCILEDKVECEEWAYYRKECPGTNPNPIDEISDELITRLGADCRNRGSEQAIGSCILDWQEKNIYWCYTHPDKTNFLEMMEEGYPDCVVDMQFQQMKPGSFPISKVMQLKTRNNKMYGACYTYATTYCAAARWNGLTCRVMAVKIISPTTFSTGKDFAEGYCGAAPKSHLDSLGYSCDEWRKLGWTVDYDHYWAEAQINGEWKIMERPLWAYKQDTQKNIIDAGRSYGDTGW